MNWTIRILQGIMAAGFIMAGLMKLVVGSEELEKLYTEPLGYTAGFMYFIGCVELLASLCLVLGYWNARFTVIGAFTLAIVMVGAFISVLSSEQNITAAISPFVWIIVALIVFFGRFSSIRYFTKKPRMT